MLGWVVKILRLLPTPKLHNMWVQWAQHTTTCVKNGEMDHALHAEKRLLQLGEEMKSRGLTLRSGKWVF
jgi:hypothetical protein